MIFKFINLLRPLFLFLPILSCVGCSSLAEESVPVLPIHSGSQCLVDKQNFNGVMVRSSEQLNELEAALNRQQLNYQPSWKGKVDFNKEHVVFISLGRKSTAGYAIQLADETAIVSGDIATLQVTTREPKPGMMLAQVMTYPCVVAKLPAKNYSRIDIKEADKLLFSIQP